MDDNPNIGSGEDGEAAAGRSREREARRGELRAAVKRGLEDIEAGRIVDLEQAFDEIEAMLDELEAAKRA
jgi:predicted transcriptional regulator